MTRLPIKKQVDATGEDYAGSVFWFFLTSLMVGGIMLGVYFVMYILVPVPLFAAFLSVIAAALFTGGLHIDGFADMCDAFFARKSSERTLEILKDSRMGAYGVIAIIFVIAVKTFLLGRIEGTVFLWPIFLALPVCGKIPMILCAMVSTYPREDGLGKYIIDLLPKKTAVWSIIICSAIVCFCAGVFAGGIAVAAMLATGFILAQISKNKIGGATGDILGAANEIGEMLFLLIVAAVLFQ